MAKSLSSIKHLFTLLIILASTSVFAEAEDTIRFVRNIEWKETWQYPERPFRENGFFKEKSGVPVVLISIPLPENFSKKNSRISIQPEEWDAFEDTLADITPRDVSVETEHRIVHIRKKPYLEIELIPFREASHKEVKWDKLLKFSVAVSYGKTSEKPEDSLKSGALKYTQTSRLADGKWVKIGTTERGVHKISYSKLEDWGFSEPSKVQVFGNGGTMVPMANNEERPDDIPPVGCIHSGDALFFYSPGPWEWTWDKGQNLLKQKKHKYSPPAFFFLSET
ncbi:MAG: hypothetical protein R6U46_12195, partial [Marinilabilia sp.]